MKKIKKNDVYRFSYSPKKEQGWDSRTHCFEGYLVAREVGDDLKLIDTYWGVYGDGRILSREKIDQEVKKGGSFEFYFNLDEVEKIEEYEEKYFDSKDIVRISEQHACVPRCVFYFKKIGAVRSKHRMLEEIDEQIRQKTHTIEFQTSMIQRLKETREKVEAGDTAQYI